MMSGGERFEAISKFINTLIGHTFISDMTRAPTFGRQLAPMCSHKHKFRAKIHTYIHIHMLYITSIFIPIYFRFDMKFYSCSVYASRLWRKLKVTNLCNRLCSLISQFVLFWRRKMMPYVLKNNHQYIKW